MNFDRFSSKTRSCGGIEHSSVKRKMVADGSYSYNHFKPMVSMSQPDQRFHSSLSQPLFKSPPLTLALRPKMENLGEMSLLGESYENSLMGKTRDDELDYRSGSENHEAGSGNDQQHDGSEDRSSKRKKYHRHTAYQIQELENAFKENPHRDEKGRLELGKKLGLEGRQVKFWFQNRRTQMKTQLERHENSMLKQENDKLRIENITMKDAMRNPICENCGSPALLGEISIEQHHLRIENARLKDELNRLSVLANKFLGSGSKPLMMSDSKLDLAIGRNGFGGFDPSMDLTLPLGFEFGNRIPSTLPVMPPQGNIDFPFDKSLLLNLAFSAMDELLKLGQVDSPMWFRSMEGDVEMLNLEEYAKSFSSNIGEKPSHFVTEGTRASGNVNFNSAMLVEGFMDVNRWTEMFPGNIGRALTVSVISAGASGNRNGTLHLMQAEFQAFSPMVPIRQVKFIRFCKQHGEGMWAVVDVSVDFLFHVANENASLICRRLPSGCIIQDLPDGSSKVIWIEHSEYDETNIPHLFRPLTRCGLAFGAPKWLANLQRQCDLFAMVMSSTSPNAALPPNGRRSIAKLAQRMTRSFCLGISGTVHDWETVQNTDDVRMMMRKSAGDSGEPSGVILSATSTIWLPVLPRNLLEFLQDEKKRCLWDVLCKEGPVEKMLHVPKSREEDSGNAISLLHENVTDPSSNQTSVFILQDTCRDISGSLMVYAAVETAGMNVAMNGGDVSNMTILPSGFSIVPDCFCDSNEASYGNGSLLTVGFQILANNTPGDKLTIESINTVKSLIAQTLHGIKANFPCN